MCGWYLLNFCFSFVLPVKYGQYSPLFQVGECGGECERGKGMNDRADSYTKWILKNLWCHLIPSGSLSCIRKIKFLKDWTSWYRYFTTFWDMKTETLWNSANSVCVCLCVCVRIYRYIYIYKVAIPRLVSFS